MLAKFNIGFAYGLNLLVGGGTQAYYNYGCFYVGVELAKAMADVLPNWADMSIEERLERLLESMDLADEIAVSREGETLTVTVRGCHFCPKRVGGYELEGTACLLPSLIAGVVHHETGAGVKLKDVLKALDWSVGEECKVSISLRQA